MQLFTIAKEHYTIITITGRLDALTADNLQASLTTLFKSGSIFLIVDCNGLEFLSSAGMRAILICLGEAKKCSGRLVFSCFNTTVLEVLKLSGIEKYLESYPSLEEAERAMFYIK